MPVHTALQAKRLIRITGGVLGSLSACAWAQPPAEPPPPEQAAQPAVPATGPVSQTIWPGIVRWYPSADAKDKAPPSLIVQIPARHFGPGPENPRIVPVFSKADGRTTVHIATEPGTSLYGGGAVPGPLLLNGRKFVAAPADRDMEPPAEHAASLAFPWVVAVRPDGTAFGVMADTTWRTELDLTDGVTLRADGPTLPVIIVDGDSPLSPPAALSQLAGWQELPPRWALGLQVGPAVLGPGAAEPLSVAKPWRDHAIPCDVLWLYAGSFLAPSSAPVPDMLSELRDSGWHGGLILDPGLWDLEITKAAVEEGTQGDHWARGPDGKAYRHPYAAETLLIPDLTRETTRLWWAGLQRMTLAARLDALGHLYDARSHRIGDNVRHEADPELGGPASHAAFRAIHGTLLARTSRDAMKSAFPDKRSYVVTTNPSLISQRYAYTFLATPPAPDSVAGAIPAILNASMSGQAMMGIDVPEADPDGDGSDLARNIAAASMLPMLRLVQTRGGWSIEPWSFSPDVEKTCREALERRSRLLPYIYTLALDAYRYGFPMIRPLMTADPANPALRDIDDAFLLGGDLLVRLKSPGGEADPASILPGWRKFDFGEESALLPEMYIRPGTIIPVGPLMQHDGEKPLEPLTLVVCLNAEGQAMGCLYEDDGTSLDYLKTQCRIAYYQATREGDEVKVRMIRLDGGMGMAKRKLNVRVLLPEGKEATAEYWDALDTKVKLP